MENVRDIFLESDQVIRMAHSSVLNKVENFERYREFDKCSFEAREIKECLEVLEEKLRDYIDTIKFLNTEPITGTLELQKNGRFSLANKELTCGHTLEVYFEKTEYDNAEWVLGRVEGRWDEEKGENVYYFCSSRRCDLKNGMKARYRRVNY